MRTTPALALVASFLASTAIGVVASPVGPTSTKLHRRSYGSVERHHRLIARNAAAVPGSSPAGSGDAKMRRKKHKGKCPAKKPKDQGSSAEERPPISNDPGEPASTEVGVGSPKDGTPADDSQAGGDKPGSKPRVENGSVSPDGSTTASGQAPDQTAAGVSGGSSEQSTGNGTHCKGVQGSSAPPSHGSIKPDWFNPKLIHHGPGTTFGGGNNFWQGGACMYDDMPHHNLPSVAMDQSFFQDGLACGTCVEIASTSASLFSNDAKWSVETPRKGTLPPGKKTVAIVSDLCPGVDQCWSGLDMHPDAWNSVTNGANGSKLPITWKFVNCKEAFERSGSGIKNLQVHWRPGANPGFFEVQIRGSHEAVVRVEMKWGQNGWKEAKLVDNSWWKWDDQSQTGFSQQSTKVSFRISDWQGQTITSEVGTPMGKDIFFDANFDTVESYSA